jgi:hypothetical protein
MSPSLSLLLLRLGRTPASSGTVCENSETCVLFLKFEKDIFFPSDLDSPLCDAAALVRARSSASEPGISAAVSMALSRIEALPGVALGGAELTERVGPLAPHSSTGGGCGCRRWAVTASSACAQASARRRHLPRVDAEAPRRAAPSSGHLPCTLATRSKEVYLIPISTPEFAIRDSDCLIQQESFVCFFDNLPYFSLQFDYLPHLANI